MNKQKNKNTKLQTVILSLLAIAVLSGILFGKRVIGKTEVKQWVAGEVLMDIIPAQEKVYINEDQIVKFTRDGVVSYNTKGEELWRDTLNLENIWVVQRTPYLAVTSKNSREITLFDEKGRMATIQVQGLICYFSINEQGSLVVIEEMEEAYRVSTYNNEGGVLGASRVSYIENGGFPMVAEISPDNTQLLIAYVNVDGPGITSSIVCVPIEAQEDTWGDNVSYGMDEKDNLIYEIEFIGEKTWVSVGDQAITFYTLEGEELAKKEGLYASYIPYLTKRAARGQTLPIVAMNQQLGSTMHSKEFLYFFDEKGEEIERYPLEDSVTYFSADDKGVMIGQGRKITGYNKMGLPYFEFNAVQDIVSVSVLDKEMIAIGKTQIIKLYPVSKEEE